MQLLLARGVAQISQILMIKQRLCIRQYRTHPEIAHFLMSKGAQGDVTTMFHEAVAAGNSDLVSQLLRGGVKVNSTDSRGEKALMKAVKNEHSTLVQLLPPRNRRRCPRQRR